MRRSIIFACGFTFLLWAAPSALADPSSTQVRDLNQPASDGSTFSVSFNNPPKANGVASTYQIVNATGPAQDATRFKYHEVIIRDQNGDIVLQAGDAKNTVGHQHELVTITYDSVGHPGFTVENTGFYVPAKGKN